MRGLLQGFLRPDPVRMGEAGVGFAFETGMVGLALALLVKPPPKTQCRSASAIRDSEMSLTPKNAMAYTMQPQRGATRHYCYYAHPQAAGCKESCCRTRSPLADLALHR